MSASLDSSSNISSKRETNVLLVDDDIEYADLAAKMIENGNSNIQVKTFNNPKKALKKIKENNLDCIISDYKMPEKNGIELLKETRVIKPNIPFILLTGKGNEGVASKAISNGVTDYFQKSSEVEQFDILRKRIKDYVKKEKKEKQKIERYKNILDSLPDPIYTLNEDCNITYVNKQMEEMTGYTENELLGKNISVLLNENDNEKRQEIISRLIENNKNKDKIQINIQTKNNQKINAEIHTGIVNYKKQFKGSSGIIRNIEKISKKQTELEQKKDRLEEFASIVSHDLRNPLNVAKINLNLALKEYENKELKKANKALNRMEEIVEDTLKLAKHGKDIGKLKKVNLKDISQRCWEIVENDNANLNIEDSTEFKADPERLHHIFENLYRNSIEHSNRDINISIGTLENGFYIEDDGEGIPEEKRDKVFEPGYSSKENGTGFGLTIIKWISDAHNWNIELKEGKNGGARFEFTEIKK